MLWSIGLVLLLGWLMGELFSFLNLPKLLGYLILGIGLGPSVFKALSPQLIDLAGDIRQMALMIILIRAGLTLKVSDLIKVGRPAILMCFVPATFEVLAIGLLGPKILAISTLDAFLLGSVLAAVSPAVLVPRMLHLMDQGLGTKKAIPQMILAGGTADDILIFVVFSMLMELSQGHHFSSLALLMAPLSVISGLSMGYLVGQLLSRLQKRYLVNGAELFYYSLTASFLLLGLEKAIPNGWPYSGVLSVLFAHLIFQRNCPTHTHKLITTYQSIWEIAEIFLFVFLGVVVNPQLTLQAGWPILIVIALGLCARMIGVACSMIKTPFNREERQFIMGAYLPKATVQASLGGLPLMAGLASGQVILVAATLAILMTAPLGAVFIDVFAPRWLEK